MEPVMLSKKALRDSFASALSTALQHRYQKVPSAAFVAKEFNLLAHSTEPITQESARRWLRGLAIPGLEKLIVLRSWLDLDLNMLGNRTQFSDAQVVDSQDGMQLPQEGFIKTTHLIKTSLQSLMLEIANLEEKLTQKI